MILRKRYKRDVKNNMSLYVSTVFLTVLSLMLFFLYHIAGTGILNFGEEFFRTQRIEDAHLTTYREIPEDDIKAYEKKFDLEMEKQEYINIETDGVTARVFDRNGRIDMYSVTEGRDAEKDNEIIITEGYARNENVKIGDKVKIRDKKYTVTGFTERPDYLYMLENLTDTEKNVNSFFICYMTDNAFEKLGEKACQYPVRYNDKSADKIREFRKQVNEDYSVNSYVAAEDNFRITMMTDQPELFLQLSYAILFTVPLLAVLLISVILSRKIKGEQKMTGTLSAFGYTKRQIICHYAGFSAIPGVAGGVLTSVVIKFTAGPYGAIGLMDYEPVDAEFTLEIPQIILGILVPTLMYVLFSAITVSRLLKNDVTVLLNKGAGEKGKTGKFFVTKDISFRIKFAIRNIIGKPGRTFLLFMGTLVGSFVILFALSCIDSISGMSGEVAGNMGNYNYKYSLNQLKEENTYGGETLLAASIEDEEGNIISVTGADHNSLIGLKTTDGNNTEIKGDEYLVSSLYATVTGVKEGDIINGINPLSMEKKKIKISGIVENNFAKAIYTSRKNVSEISGIDTDMYNIILSKEKLDIPESIVADTVSRFTVREQYRVILNQMDNMIYMFAAAGVIICIIGVYLGVNMSVSENRKNISILRVLGYDDRRINRLLLDNNIFIVIPAFIVSIPLAGRVSTEVFASFTDSIGYLITARTEPGTYVISMALVILSYFISRGLAGRKIRKADMVESLKDNRE